jgi:hypothetical protein
LGIGRPNALAELELAVNLRYRGVNVRAEPLNVVGLVFFLQQRQ